MSQLFRPSANNLARASILGGVVLLGGIGFAVLAFERSPWVTRQGVVMEQPIPFSHDHHVAQIGIDCRYCHTSVEVAASAGIPPTATCMNCHNMLFTNADMLEPVRASLREEKPLEWNRVHDLPDFAFFNHSVHLANGMGCSTCHGKVHEMQLMFRENTLQMNWCIDCHKNPAPHVRPKDKLFDTTWDPASLSDEERATLVAEYDLQPKLSCSTCHR